MPWYAIYTKPRNEKKVTEKLLQTGIEAYCPMVKEIRQWSDRKKKVEIPLISSYVFVNLEEKERQQVFEIPGVVRYLYWLGKPAIITDSEIIALRQSLQHTVQKYEVQHYNPGDKIVIPSGPFKGQEAEVKQMQGKQVKLVLDSLGVYISLYIDKEK